MACGQMQVTPTVHPTVTALDQEQVFTSKITMVYEEKAFDVYARDASIRFVPNPETGRIEDVFEYHEPACYHSESFCYTDKVNEIILKSDLLIVLSGCWRSTKQGPDYSVPVPC